MNDIKRVLALAGSQTNLANRLGITPQAALKALVIDLGDHKLLATCESLGDTLQVNGCGVFSFFRYRVAYCCLMHLVMPTKYRDTLDFLDSKDCYRPDHKAIFEASYDAAYSDASLDSVMASATRSMFELDQQRTHIDQTMKPSKPALKTMLSTIQQSIDDGADGSVIRSISTGYPEIDKRLRCLEPSKLYLIAGCLAMGKTTLALRLAEFVAMNNQDKMSCVFSMERLIEKCVASAGRADFWRIRNPATLTTHHWTMMPQLSRHVESRTCKIPVMSHLRESGALEQGANVIMCVDRNAVYAENEQRDGDMTEDDQRKTEGMFGKISSGKIETDFLAFGGEYQRFDHYEPIVGAWT